MIVTAFLVTLFVGAVLATPFQNCGSTTPVTAVDIFGCDVKPCVIPRGQIFATNITFPVDHEVSVVKSTLTMRIPGAPDLSIPLPGDACDQVSGGCPLLANSTNVFSFNADIDSTGYEGEFTAEFGLSDDHERNLACVVVSGILSSEPKKTQTVT